MRNTPGTAAQLRDEAQDEPASAGAPVRRWPRMLPWLVVGVGAAFSLWLLTFTRPGVFYSGDAGVKFLLVEQFARGELHADLRLPAEPWQRELWNAGCYPFEKPFVYHVRDRTFAQYPLAFELLTAPAYAALGWRGLYLWPMLGLLGVWLALWRLCGKLGLGPAWTALALFAVAFCSPLTLYGAMYWEHTLAVAVAMSGLAMLVTPALRSVRWNGLSAGFLLGLSVWLRSELVWLAAIVAALVPFSHRLGLELRGRRAFIGGLAVAGVALLAWNAIAYGDPRGVHAWQVLEDDLLRSRLDAVAWIVPSLLSNLALHGPPVGLAAAAAVAALALRRGDEKARGQIRLWTILGAAFALGVALVLPNNEGGDGGKQFGPRYLLVVFPVASLVLALAYRALWERTASGPRIALGAALAAALGAGVWLDAVAGARGLAGDYELRVAPVLERARLDPARTIVVAHQYWAQELSSLFGAKQFFRAQEQTDVEHLAPALWRAGEERFLVVGAIPQYGGEFELLGERGEKLALRVSLLGCAEQFCLHEARVAPAVAR